MRGIKLISAVVIVSGLIVVNVTSAMAVPTVAGSINIAAAENGGLIKAFSSEARREDGNPAPEWQVTNLIDGKHVTGSFVPQDSYGWASAKVPSDSDPEWIVIAFEGERTHLISRVVIDPATDSPSIIGRWVRDVEIQVSRTTPDGPYQTVRKGLVVNKAIQQAFDFAAPVEARYVRLLITTNHGSDLRVEMGEVEIYEAIVPDSVLDQLIITLTNLLEDLKKYRDGQLYRQARETLQEVTAQPPTPGEAEAEPQPPGEQGGEEMTPAETATQPADETPEAATVLTVNDFQLSVPAGWERAGELEDPDEGLVLVLVGLASEQAPLVFAVSQQPAADLDETIQLYADLWEEAEIVAEEDVEVAGLPARHIVLNRDGSTHSLWLLHSGESGYCLRISAPKDALEQAATAVVPLLSSFTLSD